MAGTIKPIIPPGLYRETIDTSGSPAGASGTLQYNNAGAFGGISGWTTNGTTALTGGASTTLAIGGATIGSNALAVTGTTLLSSTLTITQATADTSILSSTGYSVTGSGTTSMISLAGTLNTSGIVQVLKMDITDTASAAGSGFIQILDSATEVFRVGTGLGVNGGIHIRDGHNFRSNGGGSFILGIGSTPYIEAGASAITCRLGVGLADSGGSNAVLILRDANHIAAQKNGTNAQTFRIYGNETGSHYLNMTHNGTNAVLSVNGGGTLHISSLPTANPGAGILWNNGGTPAIGT